jgi:hypothetical protein
VACDSCVEGRGLGEFGDLCTVGAAVHGKEYVAHEGGGRGRVCGRIQNPGGDLLPPPRNLPNRRISSLHPKHNVCESECRYVDEVLDVDRRAVTLVNVLRSGAARESCHSLRKHGLQLGTKAGRVALRRKAVEAGLVRTKERKIAGRADSPAGPYLAMNSGFLHTVRREIRSAARSRWSGVGKLKPVSQVAARMRCPLEVLKKLPPHRMCRATNGVSLVATPTVASTVRFPTCMYSSRTREMATATMPTRRASSAWSPRAVGVSRMCAGMRLNMLLEM